MIPKLNTRSLAKAQRIVDAYERGEPISDVLPAWERDALLVVLAHKVLEQAPEIVPERPRAALAVLRPTVLA